MVWEDTQPEQSLQDCEIPVHVTILQSSNQAKEQSVSGPEMAKILEKIAESGGIKEITDPVAWQKEIRRDRKLPHRNG